MDDPKKLKALLAHDAGVAQSKARARRARAPLVAQFRTTVLAEATVYEKNRNAAALAFLVEKVMMAAVMAPEVDAIAEEVRALEFLVMRRVRDEYLGNARDADAKL